MRNSWCLNDVRNRFCRVGRRSIISTPPSLIHMASPASTTKHITSISSRIFWDNACDSVNYPWFNGGGSVLRWRGREGRKVHSCIDEIWLIQTNNSILNLQLLYSWDISGVCSSEEQVTVIIMNIFNSSDISSIRRSPWGLCGNRPNPYTRRSICQYQTDHWMPLFARTIPCNLQQETNVQSTFIMT